MNMGRSDLLTEMAVLSREWRAKKEEIDVIYKAKMKVLKDKCTHKWDDGSDATYEERHSYNNYWDACYICDKRWKK